MSTKQKNVIPSIRTADQDVSSPPSAWTPKEIVQQLDRHIVGQNKAKRAVAIALRNRWRRLRLPDSLRDEVVPKNILMIGPTGCGKTEIARRLARLVDAPFLKVEATKFTEVGYIGRDVDQIGRDLVEISLKETKARMRQVVEMKAKENAEERLIEILVGKGASDETRGRFRSQLAAGALEERKIDIQVEKTNSSMPSFDIPGMPGAQMGMINLGEVLGPSFGARKKNLKTTIQEARKIFVNEESEKLLDQEKIVQEALRSAEQNGIVFIDEIDKISGRAGRSGGDVSREGVQRDLLPLLEGTTIATKHGSLQTDHILFITSGAFHVSKPSDLLPELQGRLPTRVELSALGREDFVRILTEPEASLVKQYKALMATEGVTLDFLQDGIEEIALLAAEVNASVENIGARRLLTLLERLLDDISFDALDNTGKTFKIDAAYVRKHISDLAKSADLSRFIL